MSFRNITTGWLPLALSVVLVIPQLPSEAWADLQVKLEVGIPADIFPVEMGDQKDIDKESSGGPTSGGPTSGGPTSGGPTSGGPTSTVPFSGPSFDSNNSRGVVLSAAPMNMSAAKVPDEYSCPLFDNRPNSELLTAISALSAQVSSVQDCKNDTSASSIVDNNKTITDSIASLQKMTQVTDPTQVNVGGIEAAVTGALQATQNLGSILNSNGFLNSKCGRQTMSSGQALLSLNNIINGMSPYALMAVSMNAALLPALPFVIGGVAVTSGISIAAKMYNANTLDMSSPEHRKALLQNTCQFIKVAKKVRFMELAQSGQIEQISQNLESSVQAYRNKFSQPSRELYSLLKYKDASDKELAAALAQTNEDKKSLGNLDEQLAPNSDNLMACILSRELVNWAQDGKSFPASAIVNFEQVTKNLQNNSRLQAVATRAVHESSMKKITESAAQSTTDEKALMTCAQTGRAWIASVRQAVNSTAAVIDAKKKSVETELSANRDYRQWKSQYNVIQIEKVTVDRVEKALETLAKDDSFIDRSELAQRMSVLKAGLFGARGLKIPVLSGAPPVTAWLNYTKSLHDRAISDFVAAWTVLYNGSLTFNVNDPVIGFRSVDAHRVAAMNENDKNASVLSNLTLATLPVGSRGNEIACQQLESAWLSWSAALDHLGATQLFCNMIDGVIDVNMDPSVVNFCRGSVDLNGKVNWPSAITSAKSVLVQKGFKQKAGVVSAKIKELQCPMPSASVMSN